MGDDVFKEFKEHSVAEFFKKNRQMLGFSGKVRSLTTIVHELVTNSLDGAEEAGILPEVKVVINEIDRDEGRYRVRVEDNGIGIPFKHLGKALGMMLAGTKFHRYVQQRGQQGIGAAGVTMYAQLTTGKPIHAVSGYKGVKVSCDISIDFKNNRPVVSNVVKEPSDWHGLIYEAEVGDVKYDRGVYGVYEYLKRTAIANPHAQITLIDPSGEEFVFPRSVFEVPPKPKPVKPHPLGITTHDLVDFCHHSRGYSTLNQFLVNEFARFSQKKLVELRELLPDIDFKKHPHQITWEEADRIVKAFRKMKWIAPSTEGIYPIGEEQIRTSMKNILDPEFLEVVERKPSVFRGGIPFIVEVALAYGGSAGRRVAGRSTSDIMRFANRVPLLFDAGGCGITEAVRSIDWKRYGLKNFDELPVAVLVNVSSVHIPYTGAGKQALSSEDEIIGEIRNALMECARKLQRHLQGKIRERERATRKRAVSKYVNQLASDLSELAGCPDKRDWIVQQLNEIIEEKYGGTRAKMIAKKEDGEEVLLDEETG
ncbi:DNA topoisomerase VI subunit B [Candidatus Micrarchaeota archaeon]|nr:DNA topoisomerase VI subunit B [Candidatus Micrarchaeota archaeon]